MRILPVRTLPFAQNLSRVIYCTQMNTTTLSVRVDRAIKKRLEKLAKSTGRSRAFLAVQAIHEYLDLNDWQVAGIRTAMASLDAGKGTAHEDVKNWIASWGTIQESPLPTVI